MSIQRIRDKEATRMMEAFCCSRQGQAINNFRIHNHLGQFCFDMASFFYAYHFSNQSSSAAYSRASARFATASGQTMDCCEVAQQSTDIFCFAAEEYAFVRYEYMVDINHCLMVSIVLAEVDTFDVAFNFEESLVLRSTAEYECEARGISRDSASNCIFFIFRFQARRRDNDDFMSEENTGLVAFEAADIDAVRSYFVDMDIHIFIRLFARRQGTKTFDVRYGNSTGQVVLLYII